MTDFYNELNKKLSALLSGERHKIANLANSAALLFHSLSEVNWAGFYTLEEGGLVLSCFQGNVACVRIAMGHGVCGTAAAVNETQVVRDVNEFFGHIACDASSKSEIVVPLHNEKGVVVGVLDIDSTKLARFGEEDRQGLEAAAKIIEQSIDW